MKDWRALFDWLKHSGLSVSDIYEACADQYRRKQAQLKALEREEPKQLSLAL